MPTLATPRIAAFFSTSPVAGMTEPVGREDALHAGAGVGRAADDLEHAVLGIDRADPQPVGVRVLARLAHVGDAEGGQRGARVVDALDLEAEHGEPVARCRSSDASVSRCSLSQDSVNFIATARA